MTEQEFIEEVNKIYGSEHTELLAALEEIYMNGCADESTGSVDTTGHFYRVHRWIVATDNLGFREIETYDSEEEAKAEFWGLVTLEPYE